ncbi:helix-turn-helix domain-containing protein [Conchiformibius kuhniae]|uniref:Helix-turn-helix domain-containing protein n=1 Tax=Conchiformibius kuhniae TaxID=211502 RepID=A0A8T9MX40_9NEIS|nr:helix-turn-helix domain-containing protein [Conchiformibius kuhniae]
MNNQHIPFTPAGAEATAELGRALRALREQKNLTVGDVAERLKLPVRHIEALENGLYESLPEPIYIRGFLLTYGRFLDMDEGELARGLVSVAPPQSYRRDGAVSGLNYANTPIKKGFPKWIFFVLAGACVAAAVYMWQHKSNSENEKQESVSTIPTAPAAPSAENLNAANVVVKPMHEAASDGASAVLSDGASAASAPAATASSSGELVITTRYRTMLTVTNAQGKVLINKIVPANGEHRFKDGAPFEVRMGYATGATAEFNGEKIDLETKRTDGKSVAFTTGGAAAASAAQ